MYLVATFLGSDLALGEVELGGRILATITPMLRRTCVGAVNRVEGPAFTIFRLSLAIGDFFPVVLGEMSFGGLRYAAYISLVFQYPPLRRCSVSESYRLKPLYVPLCACDSMDLGVDI